MTDLTIGPDLQTFADTLKSIDSSRDNEFLSISNKKTGLFSGKLLFPSTLKNEETTIVKLLNT